MTLPDGELYERASVLFQRACDLPEGACEEFLRQEVPDDEALRTLVRSLLHQDRSSDDPLTRAASAISEVFSDIDKGDPNEVFTPSRIDKFRVLRRLGEGGMGTVYEAEQEAPRRIVALKIVRPGMTTTSNLRRFELEADALARLEHPGIARVFETGMAETPWGRVPYFAMECIHGQPLATYCATRGLSLRVKVELIALVCDAIEHAHGKGVVHRDLKSSNILVDESGNPKILDFGVARLTERDGEPHAELTIDGQVLGTLATMSPEQVRGDAHAIDARSDVYALGALAFELLTGRPPLQFDGKSLNEAARIIETVDPPKLSTLENACRGDLDVIVGKALEKDPGRRYASASALGADLRRYLRDEPILARAPNALTLVHKFVRRNRTPVLAGSFAVLALTAGTIIAVWKAIDANRQREYAASKAAESDASNRAAHRHAYRADLAAALAAMQVNDVAEAKHRLDDAPAELRGWEWDHLRSRLDESLWTVDLGRQGVSDIDVSPDGRTLAAALSAGAVELYAIEDGVRIETSSRPSPPSVIQFKTDGKSLLTAHWRANKFFYAELDVSGLSAQREWTSNATNPHNQKFDPRGALHLSALFAKRLLAHDTSNGNVLADFPIESADSWIGPFTDSARVAVADARSFGVRRISDGSTVFQRFDAGGASMVESSPDGTQLLAALYNSEALVCDAANGSTRLVLSGHGAGVTGARFSPDQRTIATSSADGSIRLFDAEFGTLRKIWRGHRGRVNLIRFTPDGKRLLTGGVDKTLRAWSAEALDDPFVLRHPDSVYGLAFSPDGTRLLSGCLFAGGPSLFLWDTATGDRIAAWFNAEVMSVAWSRDGSRFAVGRHTRHTAVINALTGAAVGSVGQHFYNTDSVDFDPVTNLIVSSGLDGKLLVSQVAPNKNLLSLSLGPRRDFVAPIYRAIVGGNGAWIAASRFDRSIVILDGRTRDARLTLTGHLVHVVALAPSPDGRLLASGSLDGEVRIWDVNTGELRATLRSHDQEVFALAFSPDGSRLASGGRDRVIRLWDTERWEEVVRLPGHTTFVYAMAFSPDGKILASGSGDDTIRLWDVRTRAERQYQRIERQRRLAVVKPIVEEAFTATDTPEEAIEKIRGAGELDKASLEIALQEAFRRAVESRPNPK